MSGTKFTVDVVALKKYMIGEGINTITKLSEKSGINRNTLSDILNEKSKPSSDVMYRLVSCLAIPPTDAGKIFFMADLRNA